MPGGNGTGPQGRGPATGKRRGPCGSWNKPDRGFEKDAEGGQNNTRSSQRIGLGQGKGRGQGQGRGLERGRNR